MPLDKDAMREYQRTYQKARRRRIRGGDPVSTLREAAFAIGDLQKRIERLEGIVLNLASEESNE